MVRLGEPTRQRQREGRNDGKADPGPHVTPCTTDDMRHTSGFGKRQFSGTDAAARHDPRQIRHSIPIAGDGERLRF